jgi:hypothetical protein
VKFCKFYSSYSLAADLTTALLGSALAILLIIAIRQYIKKDFVLKAMFVLVSLNIFTCLINLRFRTHCMELLPYNFQEGNVFFILFIAMPLWLLGFGTAIFFIKRCSTNTKLGLKTYFKSAK